MIGLVIAYLLGYVGSVAALIHPWWGVLAYIGLAITRPEHMWAYAVPLNNYSRMVAIAMLIGWVFRCGGSWRFGAARAPMLALCGFVGWTLLSSKYAVDHQLADAYVTSFLKTFAPVLVGVTLIDSPARLKQLAWTILLSEALFATRINEVYLTTGYNLALEGCASQGRALIGMAMVIGVGLSLFLGLHAEHRWQTWLAWGCALPIGHTVFLSFSRGAILSLFVTGAISFWLIPKQPKHWGILLVAILVAARMAGPNVRDRFSTTFASEEERDKSAQGRVELWKNCIQLMARRPLLGFGPGSFPVMAPEFGWPEGKEAHSLWLQLGAEQGLPGLACLAFFYGCTALRLLRLARGRARQSAPWVAAYSAMVVACIAGFATAAVFISVILMEVPFYIGLLGLGILKQNSAPGFQPELTAETHQAEWQLPVPVSP